MSNEEVTQSLAQEEEDTQLGLRVYVGNITFKTKNQDLKDAFAEFGTILVAKIAIQSSGRRLGFGFVTFETKESAQNALSVNGKDLDGRAMKVELAKPAKKRVPAVKTPANTTAGAPRTAAPRPARVPRAEREISDDVVYIGGLKDEVTEEEVSALLEGNGVQSVSLRKAYRGKERPRATFAFVFVDGAANQQKILDTFGEKEFQGETLQVSKAFKQLPKRKNNKRSRKPKAAPVEGEETTQTPTDGEKPKRKRNRKPRTRKPAAEKTETPAE